MKPIKSICHEENEEDKEKNIQKRCVNKYSVCPETNICDNCICRYPECTNYIDLCNVYRNKERYSYNTYNKIVLLANSEYCMLHSGDRFIHSLQISELLYNLL
jgi:hypothetical protein